MSHGYLLPQRPVRLTAIAVVALLSSGLAGLAQTHLPKLDGLRVRKADRGAVTATSPSIEGAARSIPTAPIQDHYILGPGDAVVVELLDVPEYSGVFTIGPDGTIYLPRLRSLFVEGLTVEELRYLLTEQYSTYVRDPQVFVSPAAYRPIRVYIGGEVARPGYYYLSGQQAAESVGSSAQFDQPRHRSIQRHGHGQGNVQNGYRGRPTNRGVNINPGLRLPPSSMLCAMLG